MGGKSYTGFGVGIAESSSAAGAEESSTSEEEEEDPSPVLNAPSRIASSTGSNEVGSLENSGLVGATLNSGPSPSTARFPTDQPINAFSNLQNSTSRRSPSPGSILLPSESSRTSPNLRSRSLPGPHHHHHHHHHHGASVPTNPTLLPIDLRLIVFGSAWDFGKLSRNVLENSLVVGAVLGGVALLLKRGGSKDLVGALEILVSMTLSLVYVFLRYTKTPTSSVTSPTPTSSASSRGPGRVGTPHTSSNLNPASTSSSVANQNNDGRSGSRGFVWGTDGRDYRESRDDGALTALLFGPLLAVSLLITTLRQLDAPTLDSALPSTAWLVEPPMILLSQPSLDGSTTAAAKGGSPLHARIALEALAKSRRSMVSLSTVIATVVLISLVASRWAEVVHARRGSEASETGGVEGSTTRASAQKEKEREKWWLPKSEWKRTGRVTIFSFAVSFAMGWLKAGMEHWECPIWEDLSVLDVALASLFHQFSMYVCVRLARRGFTLGELGVVAQFSTGLFMETVNLTRAKISFDFLTFLSTSYVQTYRLPTPLLIFQLALLPGSFLTGILLSPLLVLSRYISQKPVHRLRFPEEKALHRRYLAAGFYFGTIVIVGGGVGMWTKWQLGWRDPWVWIIWWMMDGQRLWSRGMLLAYWGALAVISVGGWEMQLAKSRKSRNRPWVTVGGPNRSVMVVPSSGGGGGGSSRAGVVGEEKGTPSTSNASNVSGTGGSAGLVPSPTTSTYPPEAGQSYPYSATNMMERVPVLSLNGRRKFFHGLAVLMFIPGIYVDPAFSHVAFSVAFAFFVFAEYVRYFALYPFGAVVHLFLNEFLDHKDSGTAILSHFYLLTGCATGLWLESPSPILAYIGVLTLGIGDAIASIVGRRFGKIRWSASSGKTVEGSIAFFVGVFVPALALQLFGIIDSLAHAKFAFTVVLSSLLEAWSCQNDNLVIPVFAWSVGSLLGV